jgi:hypothetical protein
MVSGRAANLLGALARAAFVVVIAAAVAVDDRVVRPSDHELAVVPVAGIALLGVGWSFLRRATG